MISQGNEVYLIENQDIQSLFSARKRDCHKGDFGYVGIMGGSTAYSGAIKLANMSLASLRSGAGVAGELVQKEKTDIAMIASDTISHIPKAIQEIRKKFEIFWKNHLQIIRICIK
jgi:NAD(P)H-hydrate repair Nnr-like enzyme with NAD(P)H-hydrate dehydratase domain